MVCEEAGEGGEASEFLCLQWEELLRRGEGVGTANWRWGRAVGEGSCLFVCFLPSFLFTLISYCGVVIYNKKCIFG